MKAVIALLTICLLGPPAPAAEEWHHPLYLGRGGLWRQRVAVDVRNEGAAAVAGEPVTVRVGAGAGEANLAGAAAEAVRVCRADGVEVLYGLAGPDGRDLRRGPVPAGSRLTVPAECGAKATARYYVYFDNPSAWAVPDFLPSVGGVRNASVEAGSGESPAGWQHDEPDARHRASWTSEDAHTGKRCLKTVVADGAEPTWIATRQQGISIRGGCEYTMAAWVRARGVKGDAGWYVHVGSAAETMMISPMLMGGGGTYGWKKVTARFTAPAGATRASLGTVLRGTGEAWFDDVSLECLTPAKLTAAARAVERLRVAEAGADAPWPAGSAVRVGDVRVPVAVVNFTDRPIERALAAVDATSLAHRLGGPADGKLLAHDGSRRLRHHLLGEMLLFEAAAPARAVRTFHVYRRLDAPAPAGDDGEAYGPLLAGPANLVRNGSFESGEKLPADWPGSSEGARPAGTEMGLDGGGRLGKRCVRLHVPHSSRPAWTGWRQDVPVRPGRTYVLAAWLRCEDIRGGGVQVHAHYRNAGGQLCREQQYTSLGPAMTGTSGWTLQAGTFTMPDDIATFQLHLTMNATGTVWHDGVLLAEVVAGDLGQPQPRLAPAQDGLAAWPVNAIVKVFPQTHPPEAPQPARLDAARNESEPLQIAVRSARAVANVAVEVDPPTGAGGAKLADVSVGVVGYVPIDHPTSYYRSTSPAWHRKVPTSPGRCDGWAGWWPDPILPRSSFDLPAGHTQPLWITVNVPKDAPAGTYTGAVRLMSGGKLLTRVPFTVRVWDFALPEATRFPAVYDVRMQSALWQRPGQTREQALRRMWRFLAERRLCPDRVQPDPFIRYVNGEVRADFTEYDKAAEYYFDELKLPHSYTPWLFYLFGWGHPPKTCFGERPYEGDPPYEGADKSKLRPAYKRAYQACLKAYWEHVKAKGWADRIVLYISDEPHDSQPGIVEQMKALCAMIHEVDAKIPIYSSTWHHQPAWDGSLDVWGIGHYGIVPVEKMRQLRRDGARTWFTTDGQMCTDTPFCAVERLLPHYAFHYGVGAYEFWGVDWLTYDPYQFGWHRYIHQSDRPGSSYYVRYPNGDGFLTYPGSPVGHAGIVTSIRLEQAREGVEDYELLELLRQRLAAAPEGEAKRAGEAAMKRAAALVSIPNAGGRYSTKILPDPDAVARVRRAVAEAVEALK